jgi:hypothetical protein
VLLDRVFDRRHRLSNSRDGLTGSVPPRDGPRGESIRDSLRAIAKLAHCHGHLATEAARSAGRTPDVGVVRAPEQRVSKVRR